MKYIKWADVPIFLINIFIIVLLYISISSGGFAESRILVETEDNQWIYPLDEDRTVRIQGKLGESAVEIKEGQVRFFSSPCKDKLCELKGWLGENNDWAACLPNGVMLIVQGEGIETLDAVSQ